MESLILPQKTSQRVLIEELPDVQRNTETDTQEIQVGVYDNSRTATRNGKESVEDCRVSAGDSRESNDTFRVSSDSGISIDTIEKLAEQVGSTVIERKPLNIEQKAREFKQKGVVDFEDIDD